MKTDHFAAYSEYIGLRVTASRLIGAVILATEPSYSGFSATGSRGSAALDSGIRLYCKRSDGWCPDPVVLHKPTHRKPRSRLHETWRTAVGSLWPSRECWGRGHANWVLLFQPHPPKRATEQVTLLIFPTLAAIAALGGRGDAFLTCICGRSEDTRCDGFYGKGSIRLQARFLTIIFSQTLHCLKPPDF